MINLDELKEFHRVLADEWGYFITTKDGEKIFPLDTEQWDYYNVVTSPEEFASHKGGDCWGYAIYESQWFKDHGVPYTPYCLVCEKTAVEEHENLTPASHAFTIVNLDDQYYYFEAAHKKHTGLFGPFNCEEGALKYAIDMLSEESPHGVLIKSYGKYEPLNPDTYGMSQKAYVDYLESFLWK